MQGHGLSLLTVESVSLAATLFLRPGAWSLEPPCMATLFTKIIEGQIPGRFVWRDDKVVAFLTIAPLRAGHTLVVPRAEIDHWIDLPPELAAHLLDVARKVAGGIHAAFPSKKVGL